MWFYHLQSLGSCGLASQLSANIFWASSGCLKLQKLDSFEKITKKRECTQIPPPCLVDAAISRDMVNRGYFCRLGFFGDFF